MLDAELAVLPRLIADAAEPLPHIDDRTFGEFFGRYADARVVRLGRTMSFGRVTLLSATDNKPVAMVSSAFAML